MTDSYFVQGERRAHELGNRGPIAFDEDGALRQDIVDAYWRTGFYVFEGLVGAEELGEVTADFDRMMERAPTSSTATTDAAGRPALAADLTKRQFVFVKPLSDPYGGTQENFGRWEAKMAEPEAPVDAPAEVINFVGGGALQLMDTYLRLYGHPQLLAVAERINGPDFVPWNEGMFVKQPGLGASTAWHQDGTTHWDSPELHPGSHGFNFMVQLYPTTPENALWVVPGSHHAKVDIKGQVAANGGSERLPDAVPMLCNPGDVAINNRQALHGAFANTSGGKRVTLVFGFYPRASVLGVVKGDPPVTYEAARVQRRCRIIALAIDARSQRFPDQPRYVYEPLAAELEHNHWNEGTRASLLRNYDTDTMVI